MKRNLIANYTEATITTVFTSAVEALISSAAFVKVKGKAVLDQTLLIREAATGSSYTLEYGEETPLLDGSAGIYCTKDSKEPSVKLTIKEYTFDSYSEEGEGQRKTSQVTRTKTVSLLADRGLATDYVDGTKVVVAGTGFKIESTSINGEWHSTGSSDLLADRPSATLLGKGTWQVGPAIFISDGTNFILPQLSNTSFYWDSAVACWGDSLTFGYLEPENYPLILSKYIGQTVYNGGVSGETSTSIKTRMLADTAKHSLPTIIWAGRNNFDSVVDLPDVIIPDIAAMVAALGHDRYIIVGVTTTNSEPVGNAKYISIVAKNAELAAIYGDKFLDILPILVASYDKLNAQDVIDNSTGLIPISFRPLGDTGHFRAFAYDIIVRSIMSKLAVLGGLIDGINNRITGFGDAGKPILNIEDSRNVPYITVTETGKVAINPGRETPLDELEVRGNISSRGLKWIKAKQFYGTPGVTGDWSGVAYGNGIFVVVGSSGTNKIATSYDGIEWNVQVAPAENQWKSVCYGNGLFVATSITGTGDRVMTSVDGITWTLRTSPEDNNWLSVTYGKGLFVAVANNGTNRVMTSPDGITWTVRSAATSSSWYSVTYGKGLFVAVSINGTNNRVMTSPNGITWTTRTSAADNVWVNVTYGNGMFVAVAITGTGNRIMTSPDGITWTARTGVADNDWYGVHYSQGLFIAIAATGNAYRIITSPNGIDWTPRFCPAIDNFKAITYGNGIFVAVSTTYFLTSGRAIESNKQSDHSINGGLTVRGGGVTTDSVQLVSLNTAPASATATGTLGEIRVVADFIYVCVATDTWVRAELATW